MQYGIPNLKKHEVSRGGLDDAKIREKSHILWTISEDGKYYLESCDEIPLAKTCSHCLEKINCNFSKAKEF